MIAREARKLWSAKCEKRQSGNPLGRDLVLRRHSERIVTMVHPHAGGRGLGNLGVVQILRELVSVAPATYRDSQRDAGKNIRLKKLPDRDPHAGIMRDHAGRAPNLRLLTIRDGEFVVQGVLGSSNGAAKVSQV